MREDIGKRGGGREGEKYFFNADLFCWCFTVSWILMHISTVHAMALTRCSSRTEDIVYFSNAALLCTSSHLLVVSHSQTSFPISNCKHRKIARE